MNGREVIGPAEFDLKTASALAKRRLPSVRWIVYGVMIFLLVCIVLAVAALALGPHPTTLCYRYPLLCSNVPVGEYYAVWGTLLGILLMGAAAMYRVLRRPPLPGYSKLTITDRGLDLEGDSGRSSHFNWPSGTSTLTLYDWRGLTANGRKYCPSDGTLKERGASVPLSGEAVDELIARARHLGLSVQTTSEVYASMTQSLGTYLKHEVGERAE